MKAKALELDLQSYLHLGIYSQGNVTLRQVLKSSVPQSVCKMRILELTLWSDCVSLTDPGGLLLLLICHAVSCVDGFHSLLPMTLWPSVLVQDNWTFCQKLTNNLPDREECFGESPVAKGPSLDVSFYTPGRFFILRACFLNGASRDDAYHIESSYNFQREP